MAIIESLIGVFQATTVFFTELFVQYNAIGRPVLDVLHIIFNNIFNGLLIIAILVSVLYYVMSAQVIFRKKQPKPEQPIQGNYPFVTVQIPTRNELVAIRCAKHALNFDYPKDRYEILIGDDSNQPDVSRQLKEFAASHAQVKYLKRESNVGFKPGNLNNMLKHSKGEMIVIFDSDFVPQQDFMKRIIAPFTYDKDLAGVQARWNLINSDQNMVSTLGATIVATCHHVGIPFLYDNTNIGFFCGSAEAVRKDVLIKMGGWTSGCLTEDIDMSMRLIKNGYKIEYLQNLECNCEVPYILKDLYRQQMRWAHGVVSSYKRHFVDLAKSKYLKLSQKAHLAVLFCTGYFLSVLLAGLLITGVLAFITNAPAPIDIPVFLSTVLRNVLLTSGLVVTSFVALARSNKLKLTLPMIGASFTYGLIVTYYVNVGIFKALAKAPMDWFILNKNGNKLE